DRDRLSAYVVCRLFQPSGNTSGAGTPTRLNVFIHNGLRQQLQADQLLRERSYPIGVIAAPTKVHPHVAAIGPTQGRKRLRERSDPSLKGIVFVAPDKHADEPHSLALLPARHERPCRRAAEPSDEFASSKANAHLPLPSPPSSGVQPAFGDLGRSKHLVGADI